MFVKFTTSGPRCYALADIERGFKVLKSELEIGPVCHRLPERISPCVDLLYGSDPASGDAHAVAGRQHGRHAGAGLAVTQTNPASPRFYQRCATPVWRLFYDD